MKNDEYVLYKHTSPSGKVYVGITQQEPEVRWKNGLGYADNQHFINAIKKYGWNAFSHEILFTGLSKKEAAEKEIELIKKYRATDNRFGYNVRPGGETSELAEETKEKISSAIKEMWSNPEERRKLTTAMRGKKRSDQARENISKAQKERFKDENQRKAVSEKQTGKTRTEIAKEKTSASLLRYYQNPENAQVHKQRMAEVNKRLRKRVRCIETGAIFESIFLAASSVGLCHQNLSACLVGRRKTFGGLHWEWI